MGRASDTREVLIAEALGDFVKVLDRIEAVKPTLEKSCDDLKFTAERLMGSIKPFQDRIGASALQTQDRTLGHITQQANLVSHRTAVEQIAAMQEAARRIFKEEVVPPLERIAGDLREANLRVQPPSKTWLTHAAAAVSAASCACLLTLYLVPSGAAETRLATNAPSPDCAQPALPPMKARDRS